MAEGNGQQDNLSRLDRIERAMELFVADHEEFRDEHKKLLRSQILLQDALQKQQEALQKQRENVDHLSDKIDFVVDGIDRDHREFHERLKRLEEKH
jgi:predicted  nucleic acid-binding Zn-ribbon protein